MSKERTSCLRTRENADLSDEEDPCNESTDIHLAPRQPSKPLDDRVAVAARIDIGRLLLPVELIALDNTEGIEPDVTDP